MKKQILLVDDDKTILKSLEMVLTASGYEVFTASTGTDALEIIRKNEVKVMFFDLHMPDMDGIELCETVRKEKYIELIYAMTGYSSLYDLAMCRAAGFDDMFLKPFSIDQLREVVKDSFEKISRWKSK